MSELRLAILTGRDPAELAAARAAALGACANVVLAIAGQRGASFIEHAAAMRDARAHAVLCVADGHDGDDIVDLAESLRFADEGQERPPLVLVAADERTSARVGAALGRDYERVPDPRGVEGRAAIVERLRSVRRGADVLLRDEAVERAARSLAIAASRSTTVVDVGDETTSVAFARADGTTVAMHAPIGLGTAADRVVARAGLDRVRRWIPRAIDVPALLERVFNRSHWPDARPTNALTLAIETALARECVARVLLDAQRAGMNVDGVRTADCIVGSGRLASYAPPQTVLVLLDALAPEGVTLISREEADSPVIGGDAQPRALALAASLWPRRSVTVHVVDGTGATDERIARGAFQLVPTTGAVQLTIAGTPTHASADALAVGVVVDARGRPLELPPRDAERVPTLARWHAAMGAFDGSDGA